MHAHMMNNLLVGAGLDAKPQPPAAAAKTSLLCSTVHTNKPAAVMLLNMCQHDIH
jgi:hypothetical protein